MPRFLLIEKRAYKEATLIDATDAEAARRFDGEEIATERTDSWADELLSCAQVADDEQDITL